MAIKKIIFLLIYIYLNIICYGIINEEDKGKNVLLQVFNVKFTPEGVNKIYSIKSSDGERAVIDLGHFSGKENEKRIKLGNISVQIEMKTLKAGNGSIEVETINHNKLSDFKWNYTYDITNFIGSGNPEATIIVSDLQVGNYRGTLVENGESSFGDDPTWDLIYFEYSFDLILELKNLGEKTMYGFSPHKTQGSGKAYINIKDIILDQLRGSSGMR